MCTYDLTFLMQEGKFKLSDSLVELLNISVGSQIDLSIDEQNRIISLSSDPTGNTIIEDNYIITKNDVWRQVESIINTPIMSNRSFSNPYIESIKDNYTTIYLCDYIILDND